MYPRAKFWLERSDGAYIMGPRTLRLLLAIESTGSLKAAAREAGFSYRAAWSRLRRVEQSLGFLLVESYSGGVQGGGSRLREPARDFLARYQRFLKTADQVLLEAFEQAFDDQPVSPIE